LKPKLSFLVFALTQNNSGLERQVWYLSTEYLGTIICEDFLFQLSRAYLFHFKKKVWSSIICLVVWSQVCTLSH
jgi:hypothetical protein